jgi:L-aspartate oxidase
MSRDAGVLRSPAGLERLNRALEEVPPAGAGLDLATVEATNLHAVSVLVAASARARTESRGCHRWRDIPVAGPDRPGHHTVLRVEAGRPRDVHPVRYMRDEEVGA